MENMAELRLMLSRPRLVTTCDKFSGKMQAGEDFNNLKLCTDREKR
jgi:hypothetical protein